ncbi:2OG-FeII oxygenase [Klosneuvirus KNV1]|uniref:2OG-FeII oxygenase n=1 Tax=Klosneuvirus KNV1 TaxID=1977640 RepID=A0A1V0SL59_9VIRU|nr:2OG-FeII oxygenase [Klosneuvirus KNV1]
MNSENKNSKFKRPKHEKDDGHAHIKFGQDPKPNLQKYGYCVVENVLTPMECDERIDDMWTWLEGLGTGIKRSDKTTWSNNYWPIGTLHQGMLQHSLGQEEFMWKTRENLCIRYVFYQIYNTFKLLTSFDAATICRPPESGYVQAPNNSWLHTDQKIINCKLEKVYTSDYYSIQGIVNLEDSGDEDGGFFVGEKSHLLHTKMFENNKENPKDNWYLINKDDLSFLQKEGTKFTKVNASKGALILFDSRCIHSGFPNQKGREVEKFRYVIYVSMTPAKRATKKDIDKKIKAVKEGKMTSHWSSCNVKIFGLPRTYGKPEPAYFRRKENIPDWQTWSNDRKQLSGLLTY